VLEDPILRRPMRESLVEELEYAASTLFALRGVLIKRYIYCLIDRSTCPYLCLVKSLVPAVSHVALPCFVD